MECLRHALCVARQTGHPFSTRPRRAIAAETCKPSRLISSIVPEQIREDLPSPPPSFSSPLMYPYIQSSSAAHFRLPSLPAFPTLNVQEDKQRSPVQRRVLRIVIQPGWGIIISENLLSTVEMEIKSDSKHKIQPSYTGETPAPRPSRTHSLSVITPSQTNK